MNKLFYALLSVFICIASTSVASEKITFKLNRLKDQQPQTVTEKSWPNQYLLIAVGYTGCPDVCPTTLLEISQAMKTLDKTPAIAKNIQPLFITIDPQSDTLADITKYTQYFDNRIVGLRADNYEILDNIVEQLNASYGYIFNEKPVFPPNLPKGYTVMHSTFIYLYSPTGELIDSYPYNMLGKELAKRIAKNITQ